MLTPGGVWILAVVNFAALGVVWACVAYIYPKFIAARFWVGCAAVAALSAVVGAMRGMIDPVIPVLLGNGLIMLSSCLGAAGIRRFYGRDIAWLPCLIIVVVEVVGLAVFLLWRDDIGVRIAIHSVCQSMVLALALAPQLSQRRQAVDPGARVTAGIGIAMIVVGAIRTALSLGNVGGSVQLVELNTVQAAFTLVLILLGTAWNFGFLLMAIGRLRDEVISLALTDDLTGVANRRHFLQRLQQECTASQRSQKTFVLVAIDLDGFKGINDSFGHAAGDDCLRRFSALVQARLRLRDLLARTGGDEFCIVLPATTLTEGAAMARRILDACRSGAEGSPIPIAASMGLVQWTPSIGQQPEPMMVAADQALYLAKNHGKNCYALFDSVLGPLLDSHSDAASDGQELLRPLPHAPGGPPLVPTLSRMRSTG
ncbi:GGDEF domain-containing protein [Rhodopseudomonas sp. P2A-2r]|uniref:GGDEF domain-containing protein n=1 Tax=unclassified Rhodopseudomonas TaxID=2638247 RepID=UPI0022347DB2|nr:GGDEF domain-containing protein [Rhodopseudomonas sp. P2A-2r]UZE48753.1 GGDEF domain-containing protein [Rhodopseudomonas sp. P2A-2r]